MKIIDNIKELKEEIKKLSGSVGLVPTMGALHAGHLSLIKKSVEENDKTIVSIFVNPIQFCAGEDLDKYPRTLEKDAQLCENAGVDIIFAPKVSEMYGQDKNNLTLICPPYDAVDKLCGKSRQGHFDGVCSVVAKLFNLTKANRAYFGQKDAQQLFIIQKMVKDLDFDIHMFVYDEEHGIGEMPQELQDKFNSIYRFTIYNCKDENFVNSIDSAFFEIVEKFVKDSADKISDTKTFGYSQTNKE